MNLTKQFALTKPRTCRERVELIKQFQLRETPVIGNETVSLSANEQLIKIVIEEQDIASSYKGEKKRAKKNIAAVNAVKVAVLRRVHKTPMNEVASDEDGARDYYENGGRKRGHPALFGLHSKRTWEVWFASLPPPLFFSYPHSSKSSSSAEAGNEYE